MGSWFSVVLSSLCAIARLKLVIQSRGECGQWCLRGGAGEYKAFLTAVTLGHDALEQCADCVGAHQGVGALLWSVGHIGPLLHFATAVITRCCPAVCNLKCPSHRAQNDELYRFQKQHVKMKTWFNVTGSLGLSFMAFAAIKWFSDFGKA